MKILNKGYNYSNKVMWACILGNGLETYDFTLCGVFSSIITIHYFSSTSPKSAFFATLTALSVGYFARPLGALIFGHIGDKIGRKKSLMYSMTLMAIGTGAIGLCPSYEKIGIFASIFLFIARLIQGLCAGGEISGASIFLIEHSSREKSSFSSAIIFVSGGVGCLLALSIGGFFVDITKETEIWRIPFFLGSIVGLVALYLRNSIEESPQFIESERKQILVKYPIFEAIKSYPLAMFRVICCGGFSGTMSSTVIVFSNMYLHKIINYPLKHSLFHSAIGLLSFVVTSFACSQVSSDKIRDKIILLGSIGIFLGVYPAFYFMQTGVLVLIIFGQVILGSLSGCFVSLINSFMSDLFPPEVRYSGLGLGYNIGYALCAGCLPLASFKLIELTGNVYSPVYFIMLMSVVGSVAVALFGQGTYVSHKRS
jgi:MFS family permease